MAGLSILSAVASASSYALTDLGSFGAGGSYGFGINNAGQVVGFSYTTAQNTVSSPLEAFLC